MDNIKINSNRSFGIVFFLVFLLIALYPLTNSEDVRLWSIVISLIFLVLGSVNSKPIYFQNIKKIPFRKYHLITRFNHWK